jgi:hypothetical protein
MPASVQCCADAYVRMELTQPGRGEARHVSKVRKGCASPTFDEQCQLDISPRIDDLNFTCLTLTVLGRGRLRSDEPIGQVRLGYGATELTEIEHWNLVLQHPGSEFTEWHTLMAVNS